MLKSWQNESNLPKIESNSDNTRQPVKQQLNFNFTSLYGYENRQSNQQSHCHKRVMAHSLAAFENRVNDNNNIKNWLHRMHFTE